jgi:Asp-tRNA(Asn)/Glu-tRNA(Gln) amidotransferase A subunit family amidase
VFQAPEHPFDLNPTPGTSSSGRGAGGAVLKTVLKKDVLKG